MCNSHSNLLEKKLVFHFGVKIKNQSVGNAFTKLSINMKFIQPFMISTCYCPWFFNGFVISIELWTTTDCWFHDYLSAHTGSLIYFTIPGFVSKNIKTIKKFRQIVQQRFNLLLVSISFTKKYSTTRRTVWKLQKFSLTHFLQKFRESNGFTKEVTIKK